MVIYFEIILLCISSIHFGSSFTLFARLGMLVLVKLYLFEFCLAIIGSGGGPIHARVPIHAHP